jgi:DNA-binding MarR family transcriptional regulator
MAICEDHGVDEAVMVAQGFYDLLARYLPGDTTLNELRVLTAVAVTAREGGTSVTRIVEETGISASTVSRLISQWTEGGRSARHLIRRMGGGGSSGSRRRRIA